MAQIKRNDPCPCGSGKKYKNCCLQKDREFMRDNDIGDQETDFQELDQQSPSLQLAQRIIEETGDASKEGVEKALELSKIIELISIVSDKKVKHEIIDKCVQMGSNLNILHTS